MVLLVDGEVAVGIGAEVAVGVGLGVDAPVNGVVPQETRRMSPMIARTIQR